MFSSSTHVCGVGGYSTNLTEIIIRTISAPVATFATSWTYNSVLRWISRLSSRTCTWQSSRVRFWCLILCLSSSWVFAICRYSGGCIGGSIAFWWIPVIFLLIVDWGSPWWSSSVWWRCCRGLVPVAHCLLGLKDDPDHFFLYGVLVHWGWYFLCCLPWMMTVVAG